MAPLVSGGGRSPRYEPRRVERGTETQQAPPWGDAALVVTMDVLDSREHGGGTRGPVQMLEVLRSPDEVAAVLADGGPRGGRGSAPMEPAPAATSWAARIARERPLWVMRRTSASSSAVGSQDHEGCEGGEATGRGPRSGRSGGELVGRMALRCCRRS